jgi:UDP-2,3-diacylglucosamine hydrolase
MHTRLSPEQISSNTQREPVAIFVSDVHLKESLPQTAQAFFGFLRTHAIRAQHLYLLGDLFEYWAGDDDLAAPINKQAVDALRRISEAGVALYWIAGNRDFLVGNDFAHAIGATRLPDPFVVTIGGQRLVLSHGDAQCTDDLAYMRFRNQVRDANWQHAFLAQPLAKRKAIIEGMRTESREAQRDKPAEIMDVNADAIESLFTESDTSLMIHGHTHRPARHEYRRGEQTRVRYVLPDWDCDAEPRRGGWIAMYADGTIKRFDVGGVEIC